MSARPFLEERGISRRDGVLWASDLARTFIAYNILQPLRSKPFRPRVLTVYVTYRCNLRCRICGIWKQSPSDQQPPELSLDEIERIISDPLFARLEMININGGEPNLRPDLGAIVDIFIRRLPRLKAVSLNTNGLPPQTTEANARAIASACRAKGIRFSVSLSLHATGGDFDRIAGIPRAYDRVMESFARLKTLRTDFPLYLSANCVITNLNLDRLDDLIAWSGKEGIPVSFALGEVRDRFHNKERAGDILIGGERVPALISFLRKLASRKKEFRQHALRYSRLADMLERNRPRSLSCHFYMSGAVLGSDGLLYYCKNSPPLGDCRERSAESLYYDPDNLAFRRLGLKKGRCRSCPPYTMNQLEASKDLLKILAFLAFRRPSGRT